MNFHTFPMFFCYEMEPNKLKTLAQFCFSEFDSRLFTRGGRIHIFRHLLKNF